MEGGFDVDDKKYEFEDQNSIVLLPDWTVFPLTDPNLPGAVSINLIVWMLHVYRYHYTVFRIDGFIRHAFRFRYQLLP